MARVVKCGLIQATHACSTDEPLEKIREANVEKHLKNTYLKSTQAPVGVKPVLKTWMELN